MNQVEPSPEIEQPPVENLSGLFVWIVAGSIFVGGLPYLYPTRST